MRCSRLDSPNRAQRPHPRRTVAFVGAHKTHRFVKRDALEVSSRHRYPLLTRATRSRLIGHGFEQGAANTSAAFVRIGVQHENLPDAPPGRPAATRPEHPIIATFGDQPAVPVICRAVPINQPANLVADPLEAVIRIPLNHFIYSCEFVRSAAPQARQRSCPSGARLGSRSAASSSGAVVSGKKVMVSAASTESVAVPTPFRAVNSLRN